MLFFGKLWGHQVLHVNSAYNTHILLLYLPTIAQKQINWSLFDAKVMMCDGGRICGQLKHIHLSQQLQQKKRGIDFIVQPQSLATYFCATCTMVRLKSQFWLALRGWGTFYYKSMCASVFQHSLLAMLMRWWWKLKSSISWDLTPTLMYQFIIGMPGHSNTSCM